MTKIAIILSQKGMTQRDLQRAILNKHGIKYGDDRISRIVNGKVTNYTLLTAKILADTLGVTIDDIVELNYSNL
jgi:transcriptional regulator with XRE-family HTH domain